MKVGKFYVSKREAKNGLSFFYVEGNAVHRSYFVKFLIIARDGFVKKIAPLNDNARKYGYKILGWRLFKKLDLKKNIKAKSLGCAWKKFNIPKRFREYITKNQNPSYVLMNVIYALRVNKDIDLHSVRREDWKIIFDFLKCFPVVTKKIPREPYYFLYDSVKMYRMLKKKGIVPSFKKGDNIRYIHDILAKEIQRLKTEGSIEYSLKQTSFVEKLNSLSRMKFVLPEKKEILSRWGREHNNCIGSYCNSVGNSLSIICRVTIDDSEYHALFNEGFLLKQFLGRNNSSPEPEHKKELDRVLNIVNNENRTKH